MSLLVLLHGLLPLITFVVVRRIAKRLKPAILAACAVGLLEFVAWFAVTGDPDYISLVAVALIGGLGALSLKYDDPFFFKLQPAILALLFMLIFAYFQFFTRGLGYIAVDMLGPHLPEHLVARIKDPLFLALFNYLVTAGIVAMALYAGLVFHAARRWSDGAWLAVRALGMYPIFFVVAVVASLLYPFLGGALPIK